MKPFRPPTDEGPTRLRPRDGEPRCVIEWLSQFAWRWRIEAILVYIALTVTLALYEGLAR